MLVDIVRKLLVPGEDYEYLMYFCHSPYEGVNISHLETMPIEYKYAVIDILEYDITWQLFPTEYLAEKALSLKPHASIIEVKT